MQHVDVPHGFNDFRSAPSRILLVGEFASLVFLAAKQMVLKPKLAAVLQRSPTLPCPAVLASQVCLLAPAPRHVTRSYVASFMHIAFASIYAKLDSHLHAAGLLNKHCCAHRIQVTHSSDTGNTTFTLARVEEGTNKRFGHRHAMVQHDLRATWRAEKGVDR